MTTTAQLLADSRTAHLQAAGARRAGNSANARDLFAVALYKRLEARKADPDREDAAWSEDALAPARQGVVGKQYHRVPGKTLAEVAAHRDLELEEFYRLQTGETTDPVAVHSSQIESRVLVPDHWVVRQSGVTPCVTCGHREDDHVEPDPLDAHIDALDGCQVDRCDCLSYIAAPCQHAFEQRSNQQRQCVGCGEIEQLEPKVAVEDTEAFKQLRKETKAPE